MPPLGFVTVETFDEGIRIQDRVWHIRRGGLPMQPTYCGLLHVRQGETEQLSRIAPEAICPQCLTRIEVTP